MRSPHTTAREEPSLAATRESLQTATKTQRSNNNIFLKWYGHTGTHKQNRKQVPQHVPGGGVYYLHGNRDVTWTQWSRDLKLRLFVKLRHPPPTVTGGLEKLPSGQGKLVFSSGSEQKKRDYVGDFNPQWALYECGDLTLSDVEIPKWDTWNSQDQWKQKWNPLRENPLHSPGYLTGTQRQKDKRSVFKKKKKKTFSNKESLSSKVLGQKSH